MFWILFVKPSRVRERETQSAIIENCDFGYPNDILDFWEMYTLILVRQREREKKTDFTNMSVILQNAIVVQQERYSQLQSEDSFRK